MSTNEHELKPEPRYWPDWFVLGRMDETGSMAWCRSLRTGVISVFCRPFEGTTNEHE